MAFTPAQLAQQAADREMYRSQQVPYQGAATAPITVQSGFGQDYRNTLAANNGVAATPQPANYMMGAAQPAGGGMPPPGASAGGGFTPMTPVGPPSQMGGGNNQARTNYWMNPDGSTGQPTNTPYPSNNFTKPQMISDNFGGGQPMQSAVGYMTPAQRQQFMAQFAGTAAGNSPLMQGGGGSFGGAAPTQANIANANANAASDPFFSGGMGSASMNPASMFGGASSPMPSMGSSMGSAGGAAGSGFNLQALIQALRTHGGGGGGNLTSQQGGNQYPGMNPNGSFQAY